MNETSSRQVALITGGTSGLGKAAAVELARRGWSVFCQHEGDAEGADRAVDELIEAAEAEGQRIEVASGAADLAAGAGREQLVESVLEEFERIDLLVNAAAPPRRPGDLLELTEDACGEALSAVLTSTLLLTQIVASEMVRLSEAGLVDNPRIVTLNSVHAGAASTEFPAECIARAGLAMVTRLFADRLAEHGINVYEVRVGFVATDAAEPATEAHVPIPRRGRDGDVARAVAVIAEDLLGFTTGEVIHIDGGLHMGDV